MNRLRWSIVIGLMLGAVWLGASGWLAPAQDRARPAPPDVTVEEALLRKCSIDFGQGATLDQLARYLRTTLRAPVVIDRAALDRLGIAEDATVRLELEGVRLKTALRLLLDQVGLTYRVVPEDNLLVLTDVDESADRYERILSELEALHQDVHDLQDLVEEMYDTLAPPEPDPAIQKPTLVEPVPPADGDPAAPTAEDHPRKRPRPG